MSKRKQSSQLGLLLLCLEVLLAVVALVLLLATPGVVYKTAIGDNSYSGIQSIFGGDKLSPSWAGLLSFIFIAVAVASLVFLVVLVLLKKKFAFVNLCKLIIAGLLIAGGVFLFFETAAFTSANGNLSISVGGKDYASYALGAGWIIAAILSIAGGAVSGIEVFLQK